MKKEKFMVIAIIIICIALFALYGLTLLFSGMYFIIGVIVTALLTGIILKAGFERLKEMEVEKDDISKY